MQHNISHDPNFWSAVGAIASAIAAFLSFFAAMSSARSGRRSAEMSAALKRQATSANITLTADPSSGGFVLVIKNNGPGVAHVVSIWRVTEEVFTGRYMSLMDYYDAPDLKFRTIPQIDVGKDDILQVQFNEETGNARHYVLEWHDSGDNFTQLHFSIFKLAEGKFRVNRKGAAERSAEQWIQIRRWNLRKNRMPRWVPEKIRKTTL